MDDSNDELEYSYPGEEQELNTPEKEDFQEPEPEEGYDIPCPDCKEYTDGIVCYDCGYKFPKPTFENRLGKIVINLTPGKLEISECNKYYDEHENCHCWFFLLSDETVIRVYKYDKGGMYYQSQDNKGCYVNKDISHYFPALKDQFSVLPDSGTETADEQEQDNSYHGLMQWLEKQNINLRNHEELFEVLEDTSDRKLNEIVYKFFQKDYFYNDDYWYSCKNGIWKKTKKNNFPDLIVNLHKVAKIYGRLQHFLDMQKLEHEGKLQDKDYEISWNKKNKQIDIKRDDRIVKRTDIDEALHKHIDELDLLYEQSEDMGKIQAKLKESNSYCKKLLSDIWAFFLDDRFKESLFDQDRNRFCFKNGFINTKTMRDCDYFWFFPHDKERYITQHVSYNFVRKDFVNKEIDFLHSNLRPCFDSQETYINMIQAKSYCLSGTNPRKLFFINVGKVGDNGKGVVDDLMRYTLQNDVYYGKADPTMILVEGKENISGEGAKPTLYANMWKKLVAMGEPAQGSHLSAANVKLLRGGEAIPVRDLYGKPIFEVPKFVGEIAGSNFDIGLDNFDEALKKSVVRIEWTKQFIADTEDEVTDTIKLRNDNLKPTISSDPENKIKCAWMWIMLDNYTDKFEMCDAFKLSNEEAREEQDHVKDFVEECVDILEDIDTVNGDGEKYVMNIMSMYKLARSYYNDNGYKNIPPRMLFINELNTHLPKDRIFLNINKKINGKMWRNVYLGIKSKNFVG